MGFVLVVIEEVVVVQGFVNSQVGSGDGWSFWGGILVDGQSMDNDVQRDNRIETMMVMVIIER